MRAMSLLSRVRLQTCCEVSRCTSSVWALPLAAAQCSAGFGGCLPAAAPAPARNVHASAAPGLKMAGAPIPLTTGRQACRLNTQCTELGPLGTLPPPPLLPSRTPPV